MVTGRNAKCSSFINNGWEILKMRTGRMEMVRMSALEYYGVSTQFVSLLGEFPVIKTIYDERMKAKEKKNKEPIAGHCINSLFLI